MPLLRYKRVMHFLSFRHKGDRKLKTRFLFNSTIEIRALDFSEHCTFKKIPIQEKPLHKISPKLITFEKEKLKTSAS